MPLVKSVKHLFERQILGSAIDVELGDRCFAVALAVHHRSNSVENRRGGYLFRRTPACLLKRLHDLPGAPNHHQVQRVTGLSVLTGRALGSIGQQRPYCRREASGKRARYDRREHSAHGERLVKGEE